MARKYDSSRRTEAANRTREAILAAAFRLHGQGILDFESLAIEANVSLPTVRKHFPTRELLFEGCTDYGLHVVPLPNVEAIGATFDARERLRLAVLQVCHLHEALFGHMWGAYKLEDESPASAGVTEKVTGLVGLIAGLVIEPWQIESHRSAEVRGLVIGLLHPLTYRALRKFGGLSPEQAIEQTTAALLNALEQPIEPLLQEAAHQ